MRSQPNRPIVVGAGPVGLGAALFLARQGQPPRVIEERLKPTRHSKALALNPRTLEILEACGLTEQILKLGLPIRGTYFYRRGKIVASLSFAGIHPRYPYMLALSQATTERLLAQAFEASGGRVERGVRMVACCNLSGEVEVTLEPTAGGPRDVIRSPWMLAADGAHSTARRQLGIGFHGSSFRQPWHLADAPLRTRLAQDHAHIFFGAGGGFVFLLRVVEGAPHERPGDPLWRVLSNRPEPLERLEQAEPSGAPVWTSSFHVSHRINTLLALGHVSFAGDAAHIHSPVGARGMNLGLEDAWVFARLATTGQLARYSALRLPVDRRVVRRVDLVSRVVAGEVWLARMLRSVMLPVATNIPFIRRGMLGIVTGLDHELPVRATAQPARSPA